jgi:hypothetical protein
MNLTYKIPVESGVTASLVSKAIFLPMQLALFFYLKSRVMLPPPPPKAFSPSAKRAQAQAQGTHKKDGKSE